MTEERKREIQDILEQARLCVKVGDATDLEVAMLDGGRELLAALKEARETGYRDGVEAAAQILVTHAQDWRNTLTGCPLSEEAASNIETRACEFEELVDCVRSLPATKTPAGVGETEKEGKS